MKMKLNLDELQVESFDTTPERSRKAAGTVQGFGLDTVEIISCVFPCGGSDTCGGSCGGTCNDPTCSTCAGNTCEGTCGGNTCGGTCNGLTCDNTDPCASCPSCPAIIC